MTQSVGILFSIGFEIRPLVIQRVLGVSLIQILPIIINDEVGGRYTALLQSLQSSKNACLAELPPKSVPRAVQKAIIPIFKAA